MSRKLHEVAFEIEAFSGSFDSALASFQGKVILAALRSGWQVYDRVHLAISFFTIGIPRYARDYRKAALGMKKKLLLRNQLQLIRGQDFSDLVAGVD